jgi:hypothetical protein
METWLLLRHFVVDACGEQRKASVGTSDVLAGFRTSQLPDTSLVSLLSLSLSCYPRCHRILVLIATSLAVSSLLLISSLLLQLLLLIWGHAVAQLFEELRGFDSRLYHWHLSLTSPSRLHYGPWVDSASNRNEYEEYFLGLKSVDA